MNLLLQQALSLRQQGRISEAEVLYGRILAAARGEPDVSYVRALIEAQKGNLAAAVDLFDVAMRHRPGDATLFQFRGDALRSLGRFEDALASYDRAIGIRPDFADTHAERGFTLHLLGRFEEAIASYDRSLALRPDFAVATMHRGLIKLLCGRFHEGWADWERRPRPEKPKFLQDCLQAAPLWTGDQEINGKVLFVYFASRNSGFGDTIHFCRYLKLAEARGAKVVLLAQPGLNWLMKTLSPTIELLDWGSVPERFDLHVSLLSLPAAFRTDESNIPNRVPYLEAEADRVRNWKVRLGDHGYRIGICWQGASLGQHTRSFPVQWFEKIARIPNVRLISLQKNVPLGGLAAPSGMNIETCGDDFDSGNNAFLDSAAVMANLHLIISADTSVAHLAGALGRPVWLALKQIPDWRWMLNRPDSPWYPTMRLFRQRWAGDWSSVFLEMERKLTATGSQ